MPSAYLVASPTNAVNHIHSKTPGPPSSKAVETPTIEPVPIVAESDVIKAAKSEIP